MFGICVCMILVVCVLITFARTIFYKVKDSIIKAKYTPQWELYRKGCKDRDNTYAVEYTNFGAYVRNIKKIESYGNHFLINKTIVRSHVYIFSIFFIFFASITPFAISNTREDNDIAYEYFEASYPFYQSLVDTASKDELFKFQGYQAIQEYNTEIIKHKAKQHKFWHKIYYSDKHDWSNLKLISFK